MPENSLPPVELGSKLNASLVFAYDATVLKGALKMEHPDPPYTAWYVRKGSVTFYPLESAQAPLSVHSSHWLILPPRPRSHEMSPGTRLLSIRFHLGRPGGLPVFVHAPPLVLKGHRGLESAGRKLAASVASMARTGARSELLAASPGQLSPADALMEGLRWRAAFLEWMHVFMTTILQIPDAWRLRDLPTAGSPLERALSVVNNAPLHCPLRLRDLAKEAGVSESQLKRLFSKDAGISPTNLWQQRKWVEADCLLRNTDLPLKHIALDLGFRSTTHFSTWVKQRTGKAPRQYRASAITDA